MGLVGKMTGACAIVSSDMFITENGKRLRMDVSLKALGTLGIWVSDLENRTVDDNMMILILGKTIPRNRIKIAIVYQPGSNQSKKSKFGTLEIDVQGAWKDLELDAGWSNEVRVEVFIS